MLPDWLALILSFVYIAIAIGLGEALRRWFHFSQEFTRKFIHIAVGMISVPTVIWYQHLAWAVIPPLAFVLINYADYRFGIIQAMMSSNRSNLGTVYFPLSFAVILVLFWGRPHLVVAAMMPMTWGDALAAVVGQRFGRTQYRVLGHTRTLEGSATMFLISVIAVFLALGPLPIGARLLVALTMGFSAMLAEAVSPWGIDNLTVPAISAAILLVMVG